MPNFYNTGLPTPNTKNTINSVTSLGIRDFLLNLNILPVYPQISTSLNGSPRIGEPVLDTYVTSILASIPIEVSGILYMQTAVLMNMYKNTSSTANDLESMNYIPFDNSLFPNSTQPNNLGSYPQSDSDIFAFGIMGKTLDRQFRKIATLKNLYFDESKQVDMADYITLQPLDITQQVKGYLDTYGSLNLGGSADIQALNVIGSVLNGQGLGLAKGGVVTNFDLRSSLAGRILGATGTINDTKLGMIGGQQLALALANNAAFNLQQSILGGLNVQDNILSVVKGGGLTGFRPNYQITVASGVGGKVLDYTARILGFTLPRSLLDDSGSIFLSESDTGNIERANSMILNTGKGQVTALISNMNANLIGTTAFDSPQNTYFRSGYVPGYKDNKGKKAIDPNTYAFGDADGLIYNFVGSGKKSPIPEISFNRSTMIETYGFTSMPQTSFDSGPFQTKSTWNTNEGGIVNSEYTEGQVLTTTDPATKKSLLVKTQLLFNSVGMKNIIASKGDMSIGYPTQIQTSVVGGGISHGNAVKSSAALTASLKTAEETYCRSWTSHRRYAQVQDLVRSRGLDTGNPYRLQTNGSVLDDNGFVKIAPYSTDSKTDPKKFMFSIENLAWSDNTSKLLPCEIGPGDLMSGRQGRIMWFPPYNIQFNENNSASWESTNFIGRGEPVYTYNNTERTGTLSFQIIVDHPSYMNAFRGSNGPEDDYIDSYFAGCVDLEEKWASKLTVDEQSEITSENVTVPQEKNVTPQIKPDTFNIYFPNDNFTIDFDYENGFELDGTTQIDYTTNVIGHGFGIGSYQGELGNKMTYTDKDNYGLNGKTIYHNPTLVGGVKYNGVFDPNFLPALKTYLEQKCPACKAEVTGYASSQGYPADNQILADTRAANVVTWLKANIPSLNVKATKSNKELLNTGVNGERTDTSKPKAARRAEINFVVDPLLVKGVDAEPVTSTNSGSRRVTTTIKNRFYNESNYFDKLKQEDYFIFDRIREKIKYFHPAFHSTTPEGLNSRLTFLLQCTRQGPTLGANANNLAFGRAPICILRIGDFYNTKIVIDNVGIDYEPLVWDLNPEGVGVQPMIANVNMSFKMIGGSTLLSPINKLQNALSFNYFANTQVYDSRADYVAKVSDISTSLKGEKSGTKNTVSLDGNYTIVNGNEGPMVETKTVTEEEILNSTAIIDQIRANDLSSDEQEIIPVVVPELKITGFEYSPTASFKLAEYWGLYLRFSIENGTGDYAADALTLSQQHYSLAIYDVDWVEFYEEIIIDKVLMEQFINPNNISNYFRVPIRTKTDLTGITDNFGKKTLILALRKPDGSETGFRNVEVEMFKLR